MKQFTFPALMVAAFTFLLSSCEVSTKENTAKQQNTAFDLSSAKKSIDEQNAAFQKAFEISDSVGLAQLFTTDGKMMMPGAPALVGRPAIQSAVAKFMKMNIKREARTIDVWGNEDLLVEEGTVTLSSQQGEQLEHAKYLVMWKKEEGQWKLFRDIWNTDLTPTSP